jgi:hypothetical protein
MNALDLWQNVFFTDNKIFLDKSFSAICNGDNNNIIYILGGLNPENLKTSNIIEIHLPTKTAKEKTSKLQFDTFFNNQTGVEFGNYVYFASENNHGIFKFDKFNHVEFLKLN